MATINNFDVNFSTNEVTLNFDVAISAIQTANVFLVGDGTSTTGGISLGGASVSGLGTTTLVLSLSDATINELKNQTTIGVNFSTTGLYTTTVDTTVPALDAANTNYGLVNNYNPDNERMTLQSVSFYQDINVDANGDVTSFSFEVSEPVVTLPLITEISAVDTSDSSSVALTADSSLAKSTTNPRVITVTVGTTDRTTFSDKFNIATGALAIAETTAADWAGNPFFPNQQVAVTFIAGEVQVSNWDIDLDANQITLTFDSAVNYVDPVGLTFESANQVFTLTGGTVEYLTNNTVARITMNNADAQAFAQRFIVNGGEPDASNSYLTAIGSTYPTVVDLVQPLAVGNFTASNTNLSLTSFNFYTTDSTAPYDAVFTFNQPFFTSGSFFDVTNFTLADQAAATPTNSRALTAGSTFTYLGPNPAGGVRYGLSLNAADTTAINAWAASGSMFASVAAGFAQSYTAIPITAILPANGLAAAQFITSISPDNEYAYGDIAVRSDNLAGELKLTSDYKYDAITFRTNAATQVGGVYEFGESPASNYAGRYLTISSADTTNADNPVFTLDWAEQGVTSLIAGDNITLSGSTGNVVVSSTASGGATHYTGDAGDVSLATNAQINAAITGTAVNGDSFFNTNAGSNNTQPYYVYVNGGWRQLASTPSA